MAEGGSLLGTVRITFSSTTLAMDRALGMQAGLDRYHSMLSHSLIQLEGSTQANNMGMHTLSSTRVRKGSKLAGTATLPSLQGRHFSTFRAVWQQSNVPSAQTSFERVTRLATSSSVERGEAEAELESTKASSTLSHLGVLEAATEVGPSD